MHKRMSTEEYMIHKSENDKMQINLGDVADDWHRLRITLDATNEKLARILLNCFSICKEVLRGTHTSNFSQLLVDNGWPQWFVNGLVTSQTGSHDGCKNGNKEGPPCAQEMETIKIKEEPPDSVEEDSSSQVSAESRDAFDGVGDIKSEPMDVETPSSSDCFTPTTTQESLQGLTMPKEPSGWTTKEKQQMSIATDPPVPVGLVSRCGTSLKVTPIQHQSPQSLLRNITYSPSEAQMNIGQVQSNTSSKKIGDKMAVKFPFSTSKRKSGVKSVSILDTNNSGTLGGQDKTTEPSNTVNFVPTKDTSPTKSGKHVILVVHQNTANNPPLVSQGPVASGSNNASVSSSGHTVRAEEIIQNSDTIASNIANVQFPQNVSAPSLQSLNIVGSNVINVSPASSTNLPTIRPVNPNPTLQLPAGLSQSNPINIPLVNFVNPQTSSVGISPGCMALGLPNKIINPLLNVQHLVYPFLNNLQVTSTTGLVTTTSSQSNNNLTGLGAIHGTNTLSGEVQIGGIKLETTDSCEQQIPTNGNVEINYLTLTKHNSGTKHLPVLLPKPNQGTFIDVLGTGNTEPQPSISTVNRKRGCIGSLFLQSLKKKKHISEDKNDDSDLEVDNNSEGQGKKSREVLTKSLLSYLRNFPLKQEINDGSTSESEGENEDEGMEQEDESEEVQHVIQSKFQRTSRGRLVQMPNYGAMEKGFAISDESDLPDESDDAEKDSDWDLSFEEEIVHENQDKEKKGEEIEGENKDKNVEIVDDEEDKEDDNEKPKPKPKYKYKYKYKPKPKIFVNLDDHEDKYEITKHISSHKSERNLTEEEKSYEQMTCKLCGEFSCILRKSMENHLELHLNNKLTCSKCGKIFNTTSTHKKHLREAHGVQLPVFICEICAKMFIEKNTLRIHMGSIHKKAVLHCYDKDCKEKFCTKEDVIAHAKDKHENTIYTCQTCGKQMQKLDHIVKRHSESINCQSLNVSGGETVCKICGKRVDFIGMGVHMRRDHAKIKTFNCEYCPYQTDNGRALNLHVKTHTGEHCHRCDQCDFTCIYSSQLTSHKRTHTGEKPYKCDLCPYAAAWNVQLKDHMKAHESSAKVACETCKIVLKDKRALKMHMKKQHG